MNYQMIGESSCLASGFDSVGAFWIDSGFIILGVFSLTLVDDWVVAIADSCLASSVLNDDAGLSEDTLDAGDSEGLAFFLWISAKGAQ